MECPFLLSSRLSVEQRWRDPLRQWMLDSAHQMKLDGSVAMKREQLYEHTFRNCVSGVSTVVTPQPLHQFVIYRIADSKRYSDPGSASQVVLE